MPSIQLPDDQFQQLSVMAQRAGYQDVPAFIASFVSEPVDDPRGAVTDAQLRENVAVMERGEAAIDAGRGRDMRDAISDIADKYSLDINQ